MSENELTGVVPGSMGGDITIGSDGGAHYSIPVTIPPGVLDVEPSLTIQYSSSKGNDYLGLGWSIQGISAIGRCPQNKELDGAFTTVSLTSTDRFCLDGIRLEAQDNDIYGADETVYHTIFESWSKIISHGVCGTGPCFFTVQEKDGMVIEYGNTDDSKYNTTDQSNTILSWSINKIQDIFGNYMLFNYNNDVSKGEHYITSILYTGHTSGISPFASVNFQYENRSDVLLSYIGGTAASISKRLSCIQTKLEDNVVLNYQFSYEAQPYGGWSRLSSIRQCAPDGGCLPATRIEWQNITMNWTNSGNSGTLPGEVFFSNFNQTFVRATITDINGDGIVDFSPAFTDKTGTYGTDNTVYLGIQDGGFKKVDWTLPGSIFFLDDNGPSVVGILQDLNGDGIADFTHALYDTTVADGLDLSVYLGTGNGFEQANWTLPGYVFLRHTDTGGITVDTLGILQDLNGDGIADFTHALYDTTTVDGLDLSVYLGTGNGFKKANWTLPGYVFFKDAQQVITKRGILQDLSGDGIADFTHAFDDTTAANGLDLSIYLGTGNGFEQAGWTLPGYIFFIYPTVNGVAVDTLGILQDLNGDGIADFTHALYDITAADGLDLSVYLGTGNGFKKAHWILPGYVFFKDEQQVITKRGILQDLNGDGIADFTHAFDDTTITNGLNTSIYFGTGSGFFNPQYSMYGPIFSLLNTGVIKPKGVLHDFNGDGIIDYSRAETDTTTDKSHLNIYLADSQKPNLISKITNSLGGSFAIEYAPLTNKSIYTKGTGAQYPQMDIQTTTRVVYKLVKDDGRGNSYTTSYKYEGARYDLSYRNWLGFAAVISVDEGNGVIKREEFHLNFPFTGSINSRSFMSSDGRTLRITNYSYEAISTPNFINVYQIVPITILSNHYTENGTYSYSLRQSFEYDMYGNKNYSADFGDPLESGIDTYTYNSYINDESQWLIGFLNQSKTLSTNATDVSKLFNEWNHETDLVWQNMTYYDGSDGGAVTMAVKTNAQWDTSNLGAPNNGWFGTSSIYDTRGNIKYHCSLIDAPCDQSPRSIIIQYDQFSFISNMTMPINNLGNRLIEHFIYWPAFGVKNYSMDANGAIVNYSYDRFGRLTGMSASYPTTENFTSMSEIQLIQDNQGLYLQRCVRNDWSQNNSTLWPCFKHFIDGFGREYKTHSPGLNQNQVVVAERRYDKTGRLQNKSIPYYESDGVDGWISYDYDLRGRTVNVMSPDGIITHYTYDIIPRRVEITFAYDTNLARKTITNVNSRGSVVSKIFADNSIAYYTYDKLQRLIGFADPSMLITNYTYDSIGRVLSTIEPDAGTTTFVYGIYGRLVNQTDSERQLSSYTYDALGRILTSSSKDILNQTEISTFIYDDPKHSNSLGRLSSFSTSSNTNSNIYYDLLGRVDSNNIFIAETNYPFSYVYNPLDQVLNQTSPDGRIIINHYHFNGPLQETLTQLSSTASLETIVKYPSYNALGRVLEVIYSNGASSHYSYFSPTIGFDELKNFSFVDAQGNVIKQRLFLWNQQKDIRGIEDPYNSNLNTNFSFNARGYLESAISPAVPESYSYTPSGSLRQKNDEIFSYELNSHKILSSKDPDLTWSFYNNGNMKTKKISDTIWTYTYTGYNKIETAKHNGQIVNQFQYDAIGKRVIKIDSQDNQTIYVSDDYEIVQFADGRNQHTQYILGPLGRMVAITTEDSDNIISNSEGYKSSPQLLKIASALVLVGLSSVGYILSKSFARNDDAEYNTNNVFTSGPNGAGYPIPGIFYYHHDHRVSIVLVTNSSGHKMLSLEYSPYGVLNTTLSSGLDILRYKFGGHEFDTEIGYYNFGARLYDATIAQYLTMDPKRQYFSPYMYGANNPESYIDPNGEFAILIAMLIIGAITGAYFGGEAVNHNYNPVHWNWKSGKTYAGVFGGAAIGTLGAAVAEVGGVAAGIFAGAAENAAFSAMGGGSLQDIAISAGEGAAFGALFEGLGTIARRATSSAEDAGADITADDEDSEDDSESCFCSSILNGTYVLIPGTDGNEFIPIEDLKPGMVVFALDENNHTARTIVKNFFNRNTTKIIEIQIEQNNLWITPEHQLWKNDSNSTISAIDIQTGDFLITKNGTIYVDNVVIHTDSLYEVFNLANLLGNYFVSSFSIKIESADYLEVVPKKYLKKCKKTGQTIFDRDGVPWNAKRLRGQIAKKQYATGTKISSNTLIDYTDYKGTLQDILGKTRKQISKTTGKITFPSAYDVGHLQPASLLGKIMHEAPYKFSNDEVNHVIRYIDNLRLEDYSFNRAQGASAGNIKKARVVINNAINDFHGWHTWTAVV